MTGIREPLPVRALVFLTILFLGILTLWVPGDWPAAAFLTAVYLLTAFELLLPRKAIKGTHSKLACITIGLLLLLPLWGALQIALGITVYRQATASSVIWTLSYGCVVFLTSGIPAAYVDKMRRALLWFAFAVAVIAIVQNVSGARVLGLFTFASPTRYQMGPIIYHNHWAVFVEAALPLALYGAFWPSDRSRWQPAAIAATLYASAVVSASRSGVLLCSIEIAVTALLLARSIPLRTIRRSAITLAALVALFVVVAGPDQLLERMADSDIMIGRADFNRASFAMFRSSPWQGRGVGTWPTVFPQYAISDNGTFVNQAHNDWLQWVTEGGGPYLGVFILLAALSLFNAWNSAWAMGVAAVFCQALVDYPFSRPALACWVWTVAGLSLSKRMPERLSSRRPTRADPANSSAEQARAV